jgi:hypothetical protein
VLWSAAPPLNLFMVIAHASAAAVTAMAWFLVHVECPSPDRWGTPSHRRHGSGDTCTNTSRHTLMVVDVDSPVLCNAGCRVVSGCAQRPSRHT